MRVAVVTQFGVGNASTRHRALQHLPRLSERFDEVVAFVPHESGERRAGRRGALDYFGGHAVAYVRRAAQLRRELRRFDAVLVQRGGYPMGPALVVEPLVAFAGRLVYDLDDAVFLPSVTLSRRSAATRWLYGPQQARRLLDRADSVIVSSPALAAALPGGRAADAVLPTVPDVQRYPLVDPRRPAPMRVGWVGNAGNLPHLDPLREVFERLADAGAAQLGVVSSRSWAGPCEFRRWRLEEEHSVFARFDVGIMPLIDSEYTRAKAGFKLLQYMAAGLPVVASPVGVNTQLVQESGAGVLADTPAAWDRALRELAADPELRARQGSRGRAFVESYADLGAQAERIGELLRGTPRA
jgi:hypothetical protein